MCRAECSESEIVYHRDLSYVVHNIMGIIEIELLMQNGKYSEFNYERFYLFLTLMKSIISVIYVNRALIELRKQELKLF